MLHVHNSSTFTESIDYRIVEGDTLLLDYVFFLHPVQHLYFLDGFSNKHVSNI